MNDREAVQELIAHISPDELDYQEWVNVGQIMKDAGMSCADWDDWSRNDSRYHAGECDRKWRTFGNGSGEKVGIGTLYHYAETYGDYTPNSQRMFDWTSTFNEVRIVGEGWNDLNTMPAIPDAPVIDNHDAWRRDQITRYLRAVFRSDDHVAYELQAMQDEDGKWKPSSAGVYCKTAGQITEELTRDKPKKRSIDSVLGTYEQAAGAWIRFNPVDGKGIANANITSFRYALVESDTISIEEQWALIQNLKLPCKIVVASGGKSIHAIVKIDAIDYKDYQQRVEKLYRICKANGLEVDTQDKNPSRLSRFPGFMRGDKQQYIIAEDIGCETYDEWLAYIAEESVKPLETVNAADIAKNPRPLKEPLIEGILRKGHKMMVSASSKAGKTFMLIELAIAIAEGDEWCGFKCRKGRVLYLDMELDEASFEDRLSRVYKALGYEQEHRENIDISHMRGKMDTLDNLIPQINKKGKMRTYDAIILDPIYKMGVGDENSAEDVAKFCNNIDRIATETGASVIYVHHHSKGAQGTKAGMDRASGSGVFARDADALLDLIELHISEDAREKLAEKYDDPESVTAFRLTTTLREFKRQPPINLFFTYPVHEIDDDGILEGADLEEVNRSMSYGREKGSAQNAAKAEVRRDEFDTAVQAYQLSNIGCTEIPVKHIAASCKISEKTARRYAKKQGYQVQNSMVILP